MKGLGRVLGLTMLLVCFLWAITYPSTIQAYVSKNGLINPNQQRYSGFLFAPQMGDSVKVARADSIKLKDPKMAVLYSVIPGILVHGSGHFYAGKTKTGYWLLGAEVAGAAIVYVSVLAGYAASEAGEVGTVAGFGVLGGGLLFVGSWVYDVVKSPIAVKKQNEELLQRRHSGLRLQIKDEKLKLVVTWRF